ncbi:MAG TPA: PRC and DUF2382 domain-containing protein [Candidatus Saccharimonadales bacterium]|jgi:uncharacterized protein (TIGR02271 family)
MDYKQIIGQDAIDENGNKVGTIDQLYLDGDTDEPKWATVKSGLFGTKTHFVPLALAEAGDGSVLFHTTADTIKSAPGVEADQELTPSEQALLFRHYRQGQVGDDDDDEDATEEDAAGTVGHDTSGPTTDDAMTRSEERLQVGTEQEETGRVRLRKYIVTENVQQTVPVQREEVRLEREPITDENRGQATNGPDLSEEEHEVTLHAERPVINKETVPVERVRLDKEVITDEETVSEDIRKERIELAGDEDGKAR